ncbi:hypothetical protein TIFTF001_026110 [Ficus carica]|uniref:Ubiquitin-like protease family profile domain-containing protein n=1 Tax=Ficus carica TaxID=3494 RepID=A0AA88DG26_FICCA|nr:hypothetical protein TIFTF001_026110 [Ficus carica]
MYGIRKKQSKYRDVINQDVVILIDIFSQLLVMNANEDVIIYDALMTYVKGDTPKMGKCWNGKKTLYFMYNLYDILDTNVTEKERGKHWVSVKVDLITAELVVFDCNWKFTEKVKFDRFMEPVQKMIPLVLQTSRYFGHLDPSPWPYRRPINHSRNEKLPVQKSSEHFLLAGPEQDFRIGLTGPSVKPVRESSEHFLLAGPDRDFRTGPSVRPVRKSSEHFLLTGPDQVRRQPSAHPVTSTREPNQHVPCTRAPSKSATSTRPTRSTHAPSQRALRPPSARATSHLCARALPSRAQLESAVWTWFFGPTGPENQRALVCSLVRTGFSGQA